MPVSRGRWAATILNPASGRYTAQDLSGRCLRQSPVFAGTLRGYYEFPVAEGLMSGLSTDISYSGKYVYGLIYQPAGTQPAFATIDTTQRIGIAESREEIVLRSGVSLPAMPRRNAQ